MDTTLSFLTPKPDIFSGSPVFALLVVLTLITLGTSIPALLLQANVSGVVIWIRALAAISSVLVLLWFLAGVELLNYHLGGVTGLPTVRFSPGFGIAFLLLGTALSALGLGSVGIGAVVGACIGFLLFFTPLAFFAVIIGTITCILGALVGWWIQRASSKSTSVASS